MNQPPVFIANPPPNIFYIFIIIYIIIVGVYLLSLKIFRWNEMTKEQRFNVVTANHIVLVFFVVSSILFSISLSFKSGFVLLLSFIVFVIGIALAYMFLKKARNEGRIFFNVKKQLDERVEKNIQKRRKLLDDEPIKDPNEGYVDVSLQTKREEFED